MNQAASQAMRQEWIESCAVDDVPKDDVVGIAVGGRDVAFYRVDDDIFATDNTCTHGHARLCDGFLEGHEIECPLHQGRFDVRNGKALCAPVTEDIRTYPVKIEGGKVFIDLG